MTVAHDGGSIVVGEAAALPAAAAVNDRAVVVRVTCAEVVTELVREDDNVPHHGCWSGDVVGADDAGAHAEANVGAAHSVQVRDTASQASTEQGVDEVGA